MTIDCPYVGCDNNNFFEQKCTLAVTRRMIDYAKQPDSNMCKYLRREVLRLYKSDRRLLDFLLPRV